VLGLVNKREKQKEVNMAKNLQTAIFLLALASTIGCGGDTFTDSRDGKKYKTVKIGEQVWMAENLNYAINSSECSDNDLANCKKYGRLYNWETAMKACPKGWHLPSDAEWDALTAAVGGKETAGTMLKATSGWDNHIEFDSKLEKKEEKSGNGEDKFGFNALPGGRGFEAEPDSRSRRPYFSYIGDVGYWWTSTGHRNSGAYTKSMYTGANVDWGDVRTYLASVRCLQD
jgi:uncharacterized protein (TIGR02145 family)